MEQLISVSPMLAIIAAVAAAVAGIIAFYIRNRKSKHRIIEG